MHVKSRKPKIDSSSSCYCIKNIYHPTRKQQVIFRIGHIYDFSIENEPKKNIPRILVFYYTNHNTNDYLYSKGPTFLEGIYLSIGDFYECFERYDPKVHTTNYTIFLQKQFRNYPHTYTKSFPLLPNYKHI